ncbi:hypothetical protein GCM10007897_15170 [Sphingobium jiangsuense]|uniref:Bacteriophage tail tape measure N-terminal domain-containing protein n=1 Tax=Sphingobium jiangsuense TaxID=870476 RepID=A0A7W6BDY3_9SPHN|nr:phage tail length tape measure family protein [Sphingobium jiangsuense]MBB3925038.1 hypothetical protein [Sphingobium jiangsuense]GLT00133.1 hypothetical protein GCM10007897_15170 [Sphingobium jiangsuense]
MADSEVPTLEVGFAIDTGGSFEALRQLDAAMDSTEARAIANAERIEKATSGMISLGGATAAITSFGNAVTREGAIAAREFSRVEKAGEALSRQLDRQAGAFGKTREELRRMKVEAAALAAEQQGLTELAQRLRAQEAALYDAEYAAMTRARNEASAAAEEKAEAARRAVAAAEADASAVREAAFAYQMFEARVREGARALKEAEAAARADAMEQEAQRIRSAAFAHQMFQARVREGAQALREQEAAARADAMAADRLRMSTDPLYAATRRLNDELAESSRLYRAGVTSANEYARQQVVLTQRLRDVERSFGSVGGATARNRQSMINFGMQLNDIGTMAALNAPPMQIFASQAGQIFQIFQQAEGGAAGFSKQLAGVAMRFAPLAIGVGIAATAFGLLTSEINENSKVTVTWGDVALGAFDAAKNFLETQLTKAFAFFGTTSKDVWKDVVNVTKWGVNWIIGATTVIPRLWIATFKLLPGAIGDAFYSGVNIAIDAINWLVRKGVEGINAFAARINAILPPSFRLPTIEPPQIKGIENSFAGAGLAAGKAYVGALKDTFTRDFIGEAADYLSPFAQKRAKERLAKDAKDAGKEASKAVKDGLKENPLDTALADAFSNVWKLAAEIGPQLQNLGKGQPTFGQALIQQAKDAEALAEAAADNAAAALDWYMSKLDQVSDRVDAAANSMSRAFGSVGDAIGGIITVLDEYGKRQDEIDFERKSAGVSDQRLAELRSKEISNQLSGMVALTGAAKGFFGEHSKGYKAMEAAEKALAAIQLARTAVDVAGGAARMFATLGPFAFPAVAAMLAVMASLGFKGGGSSSSYTPETNDGTGTVLGDSGAKSDSIKRAIDSLKEVDTAMLGYSREMAASLKSIESQIGNLATLVLRAGNVNASAGISTGFATDTTGKILSGIATGGGLLSSIPIVGGVFKAIGSVIGSLFGTKTSVIGSGLYGAAQSLGDILANGFDADYYSDIQKKKKTFGITTSTKYSTQYTDADPGLENQFTLILRTFSNAILLSAAPLGEATNAVEQRLNSFVVNIGKIDLQGLTGAEIEEKLTAVFGAAADNMAKAAIPGIERFQQVGEGLFDTLVRIASVAETVTSSLDLLGASFGGLTLDMKIALADRFDSLSDFTSAIDAYFEAFYSPAEQAAARTTQFASAFASLGLSMPATLTAFRELVEAQDLTTEAGQATYATLLQLAPAFADLQTSLLGAKSAADIVNERQDLERRLLELQGNTAAIRALDLAQLDASNRALQEQIWALQDAQEAAAAADRLREAWKSVSTSIMDEVRRIRGLTGANDNSTYASLLGQFNAATTAARLGDQEAAGKLTSLSQSLLSAAADVATSRQELDRIRAQTAASLEGTNAAISALAKSGSTSTASTLAAAATAAQVSGATDTTANDNLAAEVKSLREELSRMREENNAGHAATASNTGAVKRHLDNVTAQSGGDAIATVAAA